MKNKIFRSSFLLAVLGILLMLPLATSMRAENTRPNKSQTIEFHAPLNSNAKSGSVFVNDTTIGQVAWTQLADAGASDDQRARRPLQVGQVTNYLKATGFGFSIPANAVIGGVVVEVEHSAGNLMTSIKDKSIKLVKGGAIVGQERVLSPSFLSTSDTLKNYGSSTDTWGVTLTPDEINLANFGVVLAYEAFQADTARVDNIRITIHYSSRLYDSDELTLFPGTTVVSDARANDGSYLKLKTIYETAAVCLNFSGAERVGVGRIVGTNQGLMAVKIDGSYVVGSPFDNYIAYSDALPTTMHSFLWVHEGLTTSSHNICVEHTGTKNLNSTDDQIGFDYFVIAKGKKMAQRGAIVGFTPMTQSDVNATWNYASDEAGAMPDQNPTNWNGFVPKLSGEGTVVNNSMVDQVIDGAEDEGAPVPAYWIFLNESDNSLYGDHPPTEQYIHNAIANSIVTVKARYIARGKPAPKFIIESGSQYHAPHPSGVNNASQAWGQDPCSGDVDDYWACENINGIWIEEFWTKFSNDHPELVADIAGFGGHYYQRADYQNCPLSTCALLPDRVLAFTKALKEWANGKGLTDKEIWLTETSTWIGADECPGGEMLAAQQDGFSCNGPTYNARNYIGHLQDALAQQGIVNRWTWYADRYGTYHECSAGGPNDTSYAKNGKSDGEFAALNKVCTGTAEISPYGINFSQSAKYR